MYSRVEPNGQHRGRPGVVRLRFSVAIASSAIVFRNPMPGPCDPDRPLDIESVERMLSALFPEKDDAGVAARAHTFTHVIGPTLQSMVRGGRG
jgi:hypothetical protein